MFFINHISKCSVPLNVLTKCDLIGFQSLNSGLIEIFLSSNCFTYILEGDLSDAIKP